MSTGIRPGIDVTTPMEDQGFLRTFITTRITTAGITMNATMDTMDMKAAMAAHTKVTTMITIVD